MHWVHELKELGERVERYEAGLARIETGMVVSDTVACGKRGKKPLGTVKITGYPHAKHQEMKRRLTNCKIACEILVTEIDAQVEAVEQFVNAIDDAEIRRIIRHRCDGLSWQQVANRMGKTYTADSCRMIVKRFLAEK